MLCCKGYVGNSEADIDVETSERLKTGILSAVKLTKVVESLKGLTGLNGKRKIPIV